MEEAVQRQQLHNGPDWGGGQQSVSLSGMQWPTIDGPLGVYHEEAVSLAKSFYYAGFFMLPWLWFVNCFYFWPVLQHREAEPLIRPYVVKSGIGFLICTAALLSWALTFALGGERVFGDSWKHLAVYDIADKYGSIKLKGSPKKSSICNFATIQAEDSNCLLRVKQLPLFHDK